MTPRLTLYTSPACHLCDAARDVIERVRRQRRFDLETVTIDGVEDLESRFRTEIPVVHINGRFAFRYRVDAGELVREIDRANGPSDSGESWNR